MLSTDASITPDKNRAYIEGTIKTQIYLISIHKTVDNQNTKMYIKSVNKNNTTNQEDEQHDKL